MGTLFHSRPARGARAAAGMRPRRRRTDRPHPRRVGHRLGSGAALALALTALAPALGTATPVRIVSARAPSFGQTGVVTATLRVEPYPGTRCKVNLTAWVWTPDEVQVGRIGRQSVNACASATHFLLVPRVSLVPGQTYYLYVQAWNNTAGGGVVRHLATRRVVAYQTGD